MEFDVWFSKQNRVLQIVLLVIPVVGWVMEVLIRLSVMLKTSHMIHVGALLVFVLFGWLYAPVILDLISLLLRKKLIFEDLKF
jgi:hypothetical protein